MSETQEPERSPAGDRTPGSGKGKRVALVAVLLAVGLAAGALAFRNAKAFFAPPEQVSGYEEAPEKLPENVGDEDAALKIEACLGHCIFPIAYRVVEAIEPWPELARGEFLVYGSPEGQVFCEKHGETLATIAINGCNTFTLEVDGEKREIHLAGPPGGDWDLPDLALVLGDQWLEIHGELPEGFDEALAALAGNTATQPGAAE